MEAMTTNIGEQEQKKRKGICGSTLKLIAIVTMLIDHTGAVVLGRMLVQNGLLSTDNMVEWMGQNISLYMVYFVMRMIGRIAFPIFIFLMIEGLSHTRNKWKYLGRMWAFAIISEIPFNLALTGQVIEWSYQNVFFTLAIGMMCMMVCEKVEGRKWSPRPGVNRFLIIVLSAAAFGVAAFAASMMNTDYGAIGIACIMVMYWARKSRLSEVIAGCIVFLWEGTAPLAFLPIYFYNGERGLKLKYIFYCFYPLHMLILYFISCLLGLGAYPAV